MAVAAHNRLEHALVSWVLTGHNGLSTAPDTRPQGEGGPRHQPVFGAEVWCRMSPEERDPEFLKAHRYLEKCGDFEHNGKTVLASRLGYRINVRFVHAFFGRMFNHPHALFTDEMLRPELQDLAEFANGVDNIGFDAKRVAKMYFDDGSIRQACPSATGAAAHHAQ